VPHVDAPTTDVAAFEWPPASGIDASLRQDAAAIVDTAMDHPIVVPQQTTVDTTRDASAIVDAVVGGGLTESQRAMLDFERQWWRQAGAKEQAIRETFAMTPTRYYQSLNALLDLPDALSYDAALIHRLQRLRTSGTRGRRIS
jgi:Protein of unknown function (DUF3263)